MGKVKSLHIKNTCRDIYRKYNESITTDFNTNKIFLKSIMECDDYYMNRLAGYLITLKKQRWRRHSYKRRLTRKEQKKLARKRKYAG